ncbi:unnamed protein product [Symbiodinium pilosum]|uniref:Major facilitator superfamily (MFS) profile domain-containing protein n=1 Tax=Symbiodinium pilosum TaxID=2952 RepID=A0A812X1H2_SYMPI|nr:unnamed protein product [Symbiodinium pilosum]
MSEDPVAEIYSWQRQGFRCFALAMVGAFLVSGAAFLSLNVVDPGFLDNLFPRISDLVARLAYVVKGMDLAIGQGQTHSCVLSSIKDSQPTMGFETSAGMESSPVPAEPAASDVPKMTTLKHIKLDARHRCLRWKNTIASVCMFGAVSGIFGMSPLSDLMNNQVPEGWEWLAPGVTVPAVTHLLAQAVVLPATGGMAKRLEPWQTWLVVTLGMVSPLSIALSSLQGLFWLQYAGAAVASIGVAMSLEYTQVVVLQWWALDGRQNVGVAFQGMMMASSMVVISVILGITGNAWGLAGAAYSEVCLLAIIYLFPLLLVARGELGPPPASLLVAPTSHLRQSPAPSVASLVRSASFWHVVLHQFLVPFTGFGMKLLLTSVFQTTYGTSFLHSAYLASVSMVLFVAARGVFPLISQAIPLFLVLSVLLLINSVLYASYPSIIAHLPVWWLLIAKSLAGAAFAGMLCLNPLVLLQIYSPVDLPVVFAATGPARGLGFALGPVVGYYLFLACQGGGMDDQTSYNLFFYISAALSLAAAMNMLWLQKVSAHS